MRVLSPQKRDVLTTKGQGKGSIEILLDIHSSPEATLNGIAELELFHHCKYEETAQNISLPQTSDGK
jgi:hypothetical protein